MKRFGLRNLFGVSLIFLCGILFFGIGSASTFRRDRLEETGLETPGVVIELRENYDEDGVTYTPKVQFITMEGVSIEFYSSYASNPPSYQIGELVTVVYQPRNPEDAIIKGEGQLLHIFFMAFGGLFATIGLYQMYKRIRDQAYFRPE